MNRLEELERKSDDIAREKQELTGTLELLRQGEIDRMRVHGSRYLPWVVDITFPHAPTASVSGNVNRAGAPIVDTAHASNSHALLPEENEPNNERLYASQNTMSSDVDIPTVTMDDVSIIDQDGTKRYHCPCGSETNRKSGMMRHLKSKKHLSPQFPCVCGGRFTRQDTLKSHEKKCRRIIKAQNVLST